MQTNYSMVVATNDNGNTLNCWCKDYETLDAAFARLAATHRIESWEGWALSAWPREKRVEVRQGADGHLWDCGPLKYQECHCCAERTYPNMPVLCRPCYQEATP